MNHPYIRPADIRLERSTDQAWTGQEFVQVVPEWTASIDAHSYAVDPYEAGPNVSLSTTGDTAEQAYTALLDELAEQGWTARNTSTRDY